MAKNFNEMSNGALIIELIDAAYESGYYSGRNLDGEPEHKAAIARREALRKEVLSRLADSQQRPAKCHIRHCG